MVTANLCLMNFLWENLGYVNADTYGPYPPPLKIHTFLNITHLLCLGRSQCQQLWWLSNHPVYVNVCKFFSIGLNTNDDDI